MSNRKEMGIGSGEDAVIIFGLEKIKQKVLLIAWNHQGRMREVR